MFEFGGKWCDRRRSTLLNSLCINGIFTHYNCYALSVIYPLVNLGQSIGLTGHQYQNSIRFPLAPLTAPSNHTQCWQVANISADVVGRILNCFKQCVGTEHPQRRAPPTVDHTTHVRYHHQLAHRNIVG